jgi:hypothetical protein
MGFTEPKNGRHNSYDVTHVKKNKKKRKSQNLDDLKQELDIDYHKTSAEELCFKFGTHLETVSRRQIVAVFEF